MPRRQFPSPEGLPHKVEVKPHPQLQNCLVSKQKFKKGDFIHYSMFGLGWYFGQDTIHSTREYCALLRTIPYRTEHYFHRMGAHVFAGKVEASLNDVNPFDYVNHSCEPNMTIRSLCFWEAIKDIEPGDTLTCDYCAVDPFSYFEQECACGEATCRGVFTSKDWQQPQYYQYIPQYLKDQLRCMSIIEMKQKLQQRHLVIVFDERNDYALDTTVSLPSYLVNKHDAIAVHVESKQRAVRQSHGHYYKYCENSGSNQQEVINKITLICNTWDKNADSDDKTASPIIISTVNFNSDDCMGDANTKNAFAIANAIHRAFKVPHHRRFKIVGTEAVNEKQVMLEKSLETDKTSSLVTVTMLKPDVGIHKQIASVGTSILIDFEIESELYAEFRGTSQFERAADAIIHGGVEQQQQSLVIYKLYINEQKKNKRAAIVTLRAATGDIFYCSNLSSAVLPKLHSLYNIYWHVSMFSTVITPGQKVITIFLLADSDQQLQQDVEFIRENVESIAIIEPLDTEQDL